MVLKSFHGTIIMGPGWYDYHTFTIIVQPYYHDSIIFTITHPYYSVSSHLLIALWRAGYCRLTHTHTHQLCRQKEILTSHTSHRDTSQAYQP